MRTPAVRRSRPTLAVATLAAALLLGACADRAPLAPESAATRLAASDRPAAASSADAQRSLAELRRATARYHDVDVAIADGYTLLGCEGPGAGVIYVNGSLFDAQVDPSAPEALIYTEGPSGKLRLAGVELVVPAVASPNAPVFLGQAFQPEEELGVWGLHVWLWVDNPDGLFEELNPRVSCTS